MASVSEVLPKAKKSVALSGVPAGNTALCSVGRTGNDLHYRGYDILDFADQAEFEEIAYLLVHGRLPTLEELGHYKKHLRTLRALPQMLKAALECIPESAHPMDVLRTGVSVLGTLEPEKQDHGKDGAQHIADRLMASLGSMLLYWYHYAGEGRRIDVETDDDSIGAHFLHLGRNQARNGHARCTRRSSSTPSTSSTRARSPRASSRERIRTCIRRSAAPSAR
jgi:2-methylcitrate synthase